LQILKENIQKAFEVPSEGGTIDYPTDTICGLAFEETDENAL